MSDTAIEFGRRIPRITRLSLAASPFLIRWTAACSDADPVQCSDSIRHKSWHECP